MQRRKLNLGVAIAAIAAVALAAIATALWLRSRAPEWTTTSPAARADFEAGLDARMRFYLLEAADHFRKALAQDPGFAAAKVQLAWVTVDGEERMRLRRELEALDTSKLTEREAFLVEMARGKGGTLQARSEDYLAAHPRDPWALYVAAGQAWDHEEFDAAAKLYTRLLEVDPNWVLARNNLAYLEMARARFAAAEEQFRTYAFVAPDQANPHDSLGELLSLVGRYAEARAELERSISIRPDFCASYLHLAGIAVFEGKPDEIPPIASRLEEHCPREMAEDLRCEGRFLAAFISKDFVAPWREGFARCAGEPGGRGILFTRLALLAGRKDEVDAEERALDAMLSAGKEKPLSKGKARVLEVQSLHSRGLRKLGDGDPAGAVTLFRSADERATFWGVDEGRNKLFNQLNLALALERAGDRNESAKVLAAVRSVNPAFAGIYASLEERTPGRK